MQQKSKKPKRLAARTVWFAVISSVVLGLACLCTGLAVFRSDVEKEAIYRACDTTLRAATAAAYAADTAGLAGDVMGVYESLTPEQRSLTGTEEYRRFYEPLESVSAAGGAHEELVNILRNYTVNVARLSIVAYDAERGALVFLADSREGEPSYPGEWQTVPDGLMTKLVEFTDFDGDGGNTLYEFRNDADRGAMCIAGYPILDENNEKCAYVLTELHVRNLNTRLLRFANRVATVILASTLLISLLVGLRMKKTVADPINAIADTATTYVQDRKNGVDRSDHFSSLNIHTGDELENLTDVMAEMEQDLIEHEEHITQITAEKERFITELDMAGQIQAGMLPSKFPAFPERTEFDLCASMTPARMVGGDFYDFFLIDDDHLALVMADVSGKGIPGALFMMVSMTLLKNNAMISSSVGEILAMTNDLLCSNNQMEMFVTVWMGILEISTGKITAANAGHEYPAVMKDGRFSLLKDRHGFVLGGMEGSQYKEYELQLAKGDKLFVYTDGVPEATDAEGKMFGTERMIDALNRCAGLPPKEILAGVQNAVDAFVGEVEPFDDLTMMCLEYRGEAETEKSL